MLIFKEIIYNGVNAGQLPARTKASRDWYRNAATQIEDSRISPARAIKGFAAKRKVSRMSPGFMYLFKYDPKGKKTLPYYDTFPLIFPIETYPDGFLGINFHYLPHVLRAKLMNAIYTTVTDKRFDEKTKVKLSYDILRGASKYKAFKPTVKRYLYENVRSSFLEITSVEWDIALFLPLERFKKSDKQTVWNDSESTI